MRDENQLHAAVVELVALEGAEIKYSTVQNWYPRRQGRQAAASTTSSPSVAPAAERSAKISWTQVETGSAITWKYPSCMLGGRGLGGRVLLGGGDQQPPAGRHRDQDDPHRRQDTRSTIISKSISAGHGQNTYRGLVRMLPKARNARATSPSATGCCSATRNAAPTPCPYIEVKNSARRGSSTRPRPRRSATISCSTACSAA